MSNSKNAISEIKKLMVQFGFISDNSLQSFKLEDNTIIEAEKLAEGKNIFKINELFEKVALESGSYKINKFNVEVEDGKIVAVKENFMDAKLKDGTEIKIDGDAIGEGSKVTVVQGDAEVPAPDGEHELEDGDKFETKDGVVTKYTEVGPEEPADKEKEETPEAPAIDAPQGMDKEMMDMVKDFVSKMGEKVSEMEKKHKELESQFNAFKKEPAAKKIADGKTLDFNKAIEDNLDARIKALQSLRNK